MRVCVCEVDPGCVWVQCHRHLPGDSRVPPPLTADVCPCAYIFIRTTYACERHVRVLMHIYVRRYDWGRSIWAIPSYRGKLKRMAQQFTPMSWQKFEWDATSSLKRWLGISALGVGVRLFP